MFDPLLAADGMRQMLWGFFKKAVIADNARHAEAHYLLATLLRERFNDPVSADVHYRQYLEIEPQGTHAEEARQGMLRQVGP